MNSLVHSSNYKPGGSENNSPKKSSKLNEDVLFLNNGNKEMDLSTKIAPESDRQLQDTGDKKFNKKKLKSTKTKIVIDEGESKKKKKKAKSKRLVMNVS